MRGELAAAAALRFGFGGTYHSTANPIAASMSPFMTASDMRRDAIFHLPVFWFLLACVSAAAAAARFLGGCAATAALLLNSMDAAAALH